MPAVLQQEVGIVANQLNIGDRAGGFKRLYAIACEMRDSAPDLDFESPEAVRDFRERLIAAAGDIQEQSNELLTDEEVAAELREQEY